MEYQNLTIDKMADRLHHVGNRFKNMLGTKCGRLLVIGLAPTRMKEYEWICQCDCGNQVVIPGSRLRNGKTQSCGCLRREINTSHGMCGKHGVYSSEYQAYHAAKGRCNNPNNPSYGDYGGRGIQFLFTSVEELIEDIGFKQDESFSLDRIDNEGHYEKGNVRWADRKTQNTNSRHVNLITFNGITQSQREWAKQLGLAPNTLSFRLNSDTWCMSCALTLPRHARCCHK